MVNNVSNFGIANRTVSTKGKLPADSVQKQEETKQTAAQSCSYQNIQAYQTGINSSLKTGEVRQKYNEVASKLEPESRVALSNLLKSGVLLNNNSNDGSSVLDNLHKIITEPRIKGLDSSKIAAEAITAINNPGTITQTFGDIPENIAQAIFRHPELGVRSKSELVHGSGSYCCTAASIEFNLAHKYPAEFVRMAAGLSSEKFSTTKQISLSTIAENKDDAIWLLDKFKIPYNLGENNTANLKIQPDRNAIIRARVQASYRDKGERSTVDVLMQSAFMNAGSQHTYNSLNDTRSPGLMPGSENGLSNFEANFVDNIATGKAKTSVIYQKIDQDAKITDRICDYETMESQIANAVLKGENVLIGCVDTDENGRIVNGHEMTITGIYSTPNGETVFACNNTASNSTEPTMIRAKNLLPKLHHAELPNEAIGDMDVPKVSDWIEFFKEYVSA